MGFSLNFNRIKNDFIENAIDKVLGKVDKFIDTPEEREAIAIKVIAKIEERLGGDIPLLSDIEELNAVKYILSKSDMLLKAAIKLDIL